MFWIQYTSSGTTAMMVVVLHCTVYYDILQPNGVVLGINKAHRDSRKQAVASSVPCAVARAGAFPGGE